MQHAFTVLGIHTLSTGDQLVKVRNPWGKESFHGDWSDKSSKWTAALRAEVGATENDDGIFFISKDDYASQFSETFINYDTEGWQSASFVMLGDDGSKKASGGIYYGWCGDDCYHHDLTITSDVDQTIHVNAHRWEQGMYPNSCINFNQNASLFHVDWSNTIMQFMYGGTSMPSYEFKAGESREVSIEINCWQDNNAPCDWSVVAWGEKGGLSVTHKGGAQSASLPVAPAKSSDAAPIDNTDTSGGSSGGSDASGGTSGGSDASGGSSGGSDTTGGSSGDTSGGSSGGSDGTVAPVKTAAALAFDGALDALDVKGQYGVDGCWFGFKEETNPDNNQLMLMFKSECPDESKKVIFTWVMETSEWENLDYEYYVDENSKRKYDTSKLISNCKALWNGAYTQCDVTLGKYDNADTLGLSAAW